ncbi:MAG: HK97 family phage prohead protease [Alphaproteobacteria bacterium]|nr:HK97 family phage prohead protease [Alphaproteobacteria bacterium]
MTGKIEQRFSAEILTDTRASARRLIGFAARYGVVADIGPFRERIAPDAFAESIGDGADILALLDHDPTRVLGRTRSKTLQLSDEPQGLAFDIAVPNTGAGRDALALAMRGDLGGASIGFIVEQESKDGEIRVIERAKLLEISVVSAWPAYAETSVEARQWPRPAAGQLVSSRSCPTPRLDALRRYLETL